MAKMWYFQTFLGASAQRDYTSHWHRTFFVARFDPNYGIWERWVLSSFPMLRRALFNPGVSQKQGNADFYRLFAHWRIGMEVYFMAKQGKSNGSATTKAVDFWVNTRLDDEDKRAIEHDRPTLEAVLADFGSLVFQGYRLSVVPDRFSDACQASLVCVDEGAINAGCGVSARHPDIDTALIYLLYKVTKMGETPWREFGPPPREEQWG